MFGMVNQVVLKMLLDLLPEIQEEILSYCKVSDLKNLALTCSGCNEALKEWLFHTVIIPRGSDSESVAKFISNERLLKNLKNTKVLHFLASYIPEIRLKKIGGLVNLVELHYEGINDSNLCILCEGFLQQLKVLNLRYAGVTDHGLIHIKNLASLEKLVLHCSSITDLGLSFVCTMMKLKILNVSHCSYITDNGCARIRKLPVLEELYLSHCRISDMSLSHISSLITLKKLYVNDCRKVTDAGCMHISKLPVLEVLNVNCCSITDAGLSYFATLMTLKELYVSSCRGLTEKGLSSIKGLPLLQKLEYFTRMRK